MSRISLDIFPIDRSFNRIDAVGHRRLPASSCDISFRVQNRNRYQRHFLLSVESTTTTTDDSERLTNQFPFLQFSHGGPSSGGPPTAVLIPGRRERERREDERKRNSRFVSAFNGGNCRLLYKDRNKQKGKGLRRRKRTSSNYTFGEEVMEKKMMYKIFQNIFNS